MHFIDRSQRVYFYKIDIVLPASVLQAAALRRAVIVIRRGNLCRLQSAALHASLSQFSAELVI